MPENEAESQITGADTQVTNSSQVTDTATASTSQNSDQGADSGIAADTQTTTNVTTTETPDLAAIQAELETYKKKASDFEGMGKKWQTIAKDLKSQIATSSSTTKPIEEMNDWERLDSVIESKLSRLMGVAEEQDRSRVIDAMADLPYTKELGPEIKAKLNEFDQDAFFKDLPFQRRMELARAQAIAENAHIIAEISEGRGLQKAYANQGIKETKATGSTETSNATVTQTTDNILDRVASMSREEYVKNKPEIEKAVRASLGL